jgi:hypothetical protein
MNDTNSVVKMVSLTHSLVKPNSCGAGLDGVSILAMDAQVSTYTLQRCDSSATQLAYRQNGKANIVQWLRLRSVHAVCELRAKSMAVLEHSTKQDVHPTLLQQRQLQQASCSLSDRGLACNMEPEATVMHHASATHRSRHRACTCASSIHDDA